MYNDIHSFTKGKSRKRRKKKRRKNAVFAS